MRRTHWVGSLVIAASLAVCAVAHAQEDAVARMRAQRVPLLKEALAAAREAGLDILVDKINDQLAEASLQSGDLPAAKTALLDIVTRSEAKREQLAFDPDLRQQWFADNIGPYRKLLRVCAQTNDPILALSVAERMRARALVDQLAWQKVDMGLSLPQDVRDRLSALRTARRQAYDMLQWVLGGGKPEASPERAAAEDDRGSYLPIRGQHLPLRGSYLPIRGPLDSKESATAADVDKLKSLLDDLAKQETALEGAIREAVPAYQAASATTIPSGEELVALVNKIPDLAVLHYTLCDDGVVVVGLRSGQAPKVALIATTGDALWESVGKLRELIWEQKNEVIAAAHGLYDLLVTPVEDHLTGAKRLWVVADGALQLAPFSALYWKDGWYLGLRMAVATAPSLSLALSNRPPHAAASKSALIVAAPDTGAIPDPAATDDKDKRGRYLPIRGMYLPIRGSYMPIRGDGGVASALTMMATVPLPGAKEEGDAVASGIAGAAILGGKDATKPRVLQDGGDCRLLHIATHGYADPDRPEFSGLLLAGEGDRPYSVLTAQEVYLWPLKARLVTLSACQTGLGKDVAGEGLMGLTRAFIYAGAQDVVCSLWPVADKSTAKLMTALYQSLGSGATVEDALRTAQWTVMQDPALRHPFYWAAFTAVRGPG
jgi:CHAT domain-containing protein